MKKLILGAILICLVWSSCGLIATFKVRDAFQVESVANQAYREEIDFQEVNGAIIIQVEFEGRLKNLIFDTGATTKLDDDLAAYLEVENLGKIKTFDSNNNKRYIPYVRVEKFKIRDITFNDIVATVSDMEQLNIAACIDVSGILGANAMNKGIWQIDYKNKKIVFTNSRDSLQFTGDEKEINFSAIGKGVPTISIYADQAYWGQTIFDTGSNGSLAISQHYLPVNSDFVKKQAYNFGVFSAEIRIQKLANIPSLHLNNKFPLNNQLVVFEEDLPYGVIGNRLLKDFIVTFDWMDQKIFLDQHEVINKTPQKDFGFYPRFVNNRVVVGSIRSNSTAYQNGLRLNDRLMEINGINFKADSHMKYCKYIEERKSWTSLHVTVQKENSELQFEVEKSDVLESSDNLE